MTPVPPSPRSATTAPRAGRRAGVAALALLLGATLAACGGSSPSAKKQPDATPPASQSVKGGSTLVAQWPLTGLPAGHKPPNHPVLAVKIPNTAESYPQVGMAKADLVSEELVEGGITRLAVFYYQHVPQLVGPVRSMRASDIGIVKPTHAVLVSSGAAPPTLHRLNKAHVRYFTGGTGYFRDSSAAPYNLMVHLKQLSKTTHKRKPPKAYLPWGTEKDFDGAQKAKTVDVRFSAGHTTAWKYTHGHYANTNSYAPAGSRFNADSVLVLRVREGNAGYLDPAGNPVPETIFKGTGDALLFHDGKVVHGTWSKKGIAGRLQLRTKAGPMKVPAGHVWLELTPVKGDGGDVTWHK